MMRQLTIIFWSVLFGEVIGYIGGALEQLSYNHGEIGIVAAVFALIVVNSITYITNHSQPAKGSENK
ncbi:MULTISPECIES: YjzD family protein [Lactiplantibacillus]|uniref:YjzD family protein n=1 Tax=Lactiplantibacillus TaxID=2767842 RepID=UPI001C1F2DD8|nr:MULTISPECIES: YjzD family protein [Lactiplantibacillus]MBU7447739.1 YjzD family protein [Lactiplantibacillus sp. 7.2.4]MBU7479627.1 YjzD family protein [Lactiplantibacillus pentosus]